MQRFWTLLGLQVAVLFLGTLAYLNYDSDALYRWLGGEIRFNQAEAACSLHESECSGTFPSGGQIALSITPRPLSVMEPLNFELKTTGVHALELEAELYGLSMNMGRYHYPLKKTADGIYRAHNAMIPSCVGPMKWRLNIIKKGALEREGVFFTFRTEL